MGQSSDEGIASGLTSAEIGIFGYAATRIAASLQARGGNRAAPPEGFIVKGKAGPLNWGELERAAAWTERLQQTKVVEQPAEADGMLHDAR